jgi:hypothetical protein
MSTEKSYASVGTIGVIAAGLMFVIGTPQVASSAPVQVGVCDILKKPAAFNGEELAVTGLVHVAFERFVIMDTCGSIWLAFPEEPGISPLPNFKLSRSKTFDKFQRALATRDVSATLVGRLDGVDEIKSGTSVRRVRSSRPGEKAYVVNHYSSGFGHMGQYRARLVIREVVNIRQLQKKNPSSAR